MDKLPSLQLYALRHPDLEQAAWVRARTGEASKTEEAPIALSSETGIPVIISNDYEWVLYSEGQGHRCNDNDERPLPHWEYLLTVRGPADLRGMPEYIRALGEHRAPQRPGQAKVGRAFTRSTPLELRSIPTAPVAPLVQVFHSGYPKLYNTDAREILGYKRDFDSVGIGKVALLVLQEGVECPAVGDIVKARLKGDGSDHIVTGKVAHISIVVHVFSIEKS
jgi:hypothetical protein